MLRDVKIRLQGDVALTVQRLFANRADALLDDLFVQALAEWRSLGFNRFDNSETSCTVRLFDCADRVLRRDQRKWALVRVQYEGPQPTPAIRAGTVNPNASPRPDLVLSVGSAQMNVEAKRVGVRSPLPRDYVFRGLMRFIDGHYEARPDRPAHMLGYVLTDRPADCVAAINRVILGAPELGQGHELRAVGGAGSLIDRYKSDHGNGLALVHFHFDLR